MLGKRKKLFVLVGLILFAAVIALFFVASYVGPRIIIKTSGSKFQAYKYRQRGDVAALGLNYDSLNIKTNDGLLVKGVVIKTRREKQLGTVIFIHGIRASKEIYVPMAETLSRLGYNSVLFDLRAHGESEGEFCTYGYQEKSDVRILIDSLEKRNDISRCYGVWGQSLGGAIALLALETEPRLSFGIVESTFADFRTIVHDYSRCMLHGERELMVDYFIHRAEKLGNFNGDEVKPKVAAQNINQPVFYAHGNVDNRINVEYGKEIFENLGSEIKHLEIVDSAKHTNVWEKGGEDYFNKVLEFVEMVCQNK